MIGDMKLALVTVAIFLLACDGGGGESPKDDGGGPRVVSVKVGGRTLAALTGRVIDEKRKPIEGAVLRAHLPFGAGADGIRGIEAVSDATGEFAIELEKRLAPRMDSPVYLSVRADGYVSQRFRLSTYRPGLGQSMEITLARAGSVTGRVVTVEGEPVSGALVFAIPPEWPGVREEAELGTTRTGADGAFRLLGIPRGKIDLGVRADGFVPALRGPISIVAGRTTEAMELLVREGGSISGAVLTPEGSPVPQAVIRAWRNRDYRDFVLFGRGGVELSGGRARTDGEGRFEIEGLGPGKYTVDAEALGHHVVDASRDEVEPGTTDVAFVLGRNTFAAMEVIDRETGKPVGEFRVIVSPLTDQPAVRTDDRVNSPMGTFRFAVLPGVEYKLEVLAEGYDIGVVKAGPAREGATLPVPVYLAPRKK